MRSVKQSKKFIFLAMIFAGSLFGASMHSAYALEVTQASLKSSSVSDISLFVFEERIGSIVKEIARRENISTKISLKVRGHIRNRKLVGQREEILNKIANEYDLEWFLHNKTLYVSSKSERTTRVPKLGSLHVEDVLQALQKSGLDFERFSTQPLPDRTAMIITGPPNYVALVETLITTMRGPEDTGSGANAGGGPVIDVYRGTARQKVRVDRTRWRASGN